MNIKYFKDIVAPKIQKTVESNLLEKSAKKSAVSNALDSMFQIDLAEHALPEGFTPQLQEMLKLGRKEFLAMLLNPELKNPDFVPNLMDKYDQVFGDASYDALYYVTALPRDKVLRILDAKELSKIPDAAVRNSKAAEVLNVTDFKKISSQSIKNLNPDSTVTIFKKPVTIDQLKSDVYKRYAEEFKKLTGVELSKSEVIDLATETPRFKEIERLENEMLDLNSKHYTIYGAVSHPGGDDYSGFILGNTNINKSDPAIKLMHQLINNLKGTTLSGKDLSKLEDKVLNTIPKNRTYLYSSDEQHPSIGGYFTLDTGLSFVNTRVSDPNIAHSILIHEGLSHATDGVLPKKIKLTYQDLISAFNLTPKTPESTKWEELRATLTELKNKLAPDGSIKTLLKKVEQMDSEELASHLYEINAYGRDYADNLRSSTSPELKASAIKNAIVTLPVGLLAVLFGTQAVENSDITSAKNGGIIKAQDGTKFLVIKEEPEFDYEEPEFNFRHLNDELEALDLDNYLTDLYYLKRIKYGQPDKDAIQEIQRHYNLSKDLIQETFDDLYNYGLGRVLTADLEDHPIEDVTPGEQQIDDETVTLKNGGTIPKYSIGAAIKKFIGAELSNPELTTRVIRDTTSEAAEKIVPELFLSSGTNKVISKVTTDHLQKAAKATGDKRIEILANFALQCRDKGIKLPEDFNNYVDAIFKTPVKVSSDKKVRKVGEEITAEPEVVTWNGVSLERPTFEKTKNKTQTEHTGDFEDKITFKRTIPKTLEELEILGPKLDKAIESLKDMMSGKEFKLTASMMDELYLKSLRRVQNFADTADNSKFLRKFYRQVEYPKIVNNLLRHDYVGPTTDNPELTRFFEESKNNLDWYRLAIDLAQISKQAPIKDAKIVPIITRPSLQELAVYKNMDGNVSFLPKQTMTKLNNSYISLYLVSVDGKPIYGIPLFNYDEHHIVPLALLEIKAYLENPNPKSKILHAFDYLKLVKVDGSKDPFYGQFILLPREHHVGKDGIHAYDTLSLQDLQRLKSLSRTGRFKTLDDLLYYYNRLKAALVQGSFKTGGLITYFKN